MYTCPVAFDTPLRINLQYLKWPRFNFNLTGPWSYKVMGSLMHSSTLLRPCFDTQIRSILENDPWTFDANSFVLRFVALQPSTSSSSYNMCFTALAFLLGDPYSEGSPSNFPFKVHQKSPPGIIIPLSSPSVIIMITWMQLYCVVIEIMTHPS